MKRISQAIIAIALFLAALTDIRADMSIDMVRVTCIPELQYHTREQKEYTLLAEAIAHGFESFDDAGRQRRLTLLRGYGLHLPGSNKQGCPVPLRELSVATGSQKNGRSVDFVRITCIPQLRYFEVEAVSDPYLKRATEKNGVVTLEKHGLYSPSNLKYTCVLPESVYELTTTSVSSTDNKTSGTSTTTTFSLRVNEKDWFRNVLLSSNYFDKPSVASVIVSDGKQGWTGKRELLVCLKETELTESKCHFSWLPLGDFVTPGEFTYFPITQESLVSEVKKW